MKPLKNKILLFALVLMTISGYFISCTHEDEPTPTGPDPSLQLIAKKTSTVPVIDGQIDGLWDNASGINFTTEVVDPGNQVFKGYVSDKYYITLRALYDADNIYFLAEWNDLTKDLNRDTWYFDPAVKIWKQESNKPAFDESGIKTREAFYEDKLAMLFNVSNSVEGWNSKTCYASCHTSLTPDQGLARHYTTGNERIDMWHWKGTRTNINSQFDDQYQNDDFPNGRHGDSKTGGGYTDNIQTLNNGTAVVTVPKYFIPGRTYYYWITQAEIDAGTAKEITAVDADGILTYAGGTVDPNTDTDFQRDGATTGSKGMPSIYTAPFVGSRGDITSVGVHTGSGWVLEYKRALKTGDTEGQDVDFSSLQDQYFGLSVFDNAAIAHSIKPGLLLTFEK